ncbi:MAG: OadG family protein [Clostridiales bacterium]|nr:OadG family protein [Clostridiales bacterium]
MTILEKLGQGTWALVLGMVIVFAALFLLIVAIVIMRQAIRLARSPKSEKDAPISEAPAQESDEEAVVAVIMAAVAAMGGAEGTRFRLKAFRRAADQHAWSRAARRSITYL